MVDGKLGTEVWWVNYFVLTVGYSDLLVGIGLWEGSKWKEDPICNYLFFFNIYLFMLKRQIVNFLNKFWCNPGCSPLFKLTIHHMNVD